MRLIDADALINDRETFIVIGAGDNICIDIADINKAPAVDAVPVVRCKDCECWDEENKGGRATLGTLVCACDNWSNQEDGYFRYTRPDDFCSYGERRTDADN